MELNFRKITRNAIKNKYYLLLICPAVLYYVIFQYIPMYGVVIAFKNYTIGRGFFGSDWVGFRWFIEFVNSIYFVRLMRNTLLLSLYTLIFSFPVPILFALMLNEIRSTMLKRVTQTISYLPYFISTVIIVGIITNFMSLNTGIVNQMIAFFGGKQINFMNDPDWFRTIFVASDVWQFFGFSSIIYLAAIASVDQELYEAIKIDGGNKLQSIIYITIPGIAPVIIILLILNIGQLLTVSFEKVFLIYNPLTYETADVIGTYVYRVGILEGRYSYTTAVSMFVSILNFILLIFANKAARKFSDSSLF